MKLPDPFGVRRRREARERCRREGAESAARHKAAMAELERVVFGDGRPRGRRPVPPPIGGHR